MEKYFYYLAKHLVKQGIDVEILTSLASSQVRSREYDGIKYTFLPPGIPTKGVRKLLFGLAYNHFNLSVLRYLTKAHFDVVHGCAGVHFYSLLRNRKPVVIQPFGLENFRTHGLRRLYNAVTPRKGCLPSRRR